VALCLCAVPVHLYSVTASCTACYCVPCMSFPPCQPVQCSASASAHTRSIPHKLHPPASIQGPNCYHKSCSVTVQPAITGRRIAARHVWTCLHSYVQAGSSPACDSSTHTPSLPGQGEYLRSRTAAGGSGPWGVLHTSCFARELSCCNPLAGEIQARLTCCSTKCSGGACTVPESAASGTQPLEAPAHRCCRQQVPAGTLLPVTAAAAALTRQTSHAMGACCCANKTASHKETCGSCCSRFLYVWQRFPDFCDLGDLVHSNQRKRSEGKEGSEEKKVFCILV
jgi:hypothetical protein